MDLQPAEDIYERATQTVRFIRSMLPRELQHPLTGIICGSGLGGLIDTLKPDSRVEIPYRLIPNFPTTTGKSRA